MKLINFLFILFLTNQLNAQSNLIIPDFFSKASTSKINGDLILVGNKANEATLLILNSSNQITLAKKIPSMENICAIAEKNNSIYVTGSSNNKQQIFKLDNSGNLVWALESQIQYSIYEPFLKLYGDTILTGFASADGTHLSTIDTNGNIRWAKTIPFTSSNTSDQRGDAWKSGNDIYVTFSYFNNLMIAKISSSGNLIWHKRYYKSNFHPFFLNKTIVKNENLFIINGSLQTDPFVFEIDSLGNFILAKSFHHTNSNFSFSEQIISKNETYFYTGYHDDLLSPIAIYRFYMTELDSNFNLISQFDLGGWCEPKLFNNSFIFHDSQFEYTRNYGNLSDTTELLRFQNFNQVVCDTSITYSTINNHSGFTITSYTDLNNGPTYLSIAPASIPASISFSFGCPIMSTNENIIGNLEIYPNPNNGQFSLELPEINKISTLEIYNSIGQIIHSEKINPNENYKNLNLNLESGIYFILLESENETISRNKMIVE